MSSKRICDGLLEATIFASPTFTKNSLVSTPHSATRVFRRSTTPRNADRSGVSDRVPTTVQHALLLLRIVTPVLQTTIALASSILVRHFFLGEILFAKELSMPKQRQRVLVYYQYVAYDSRHVSNDLFIVFLGLFGGILAQNDDNSTATFA